MNESSELKGKEIPYWVHFAMQIIISDNKNRLANRARGVIFDLLVTAFSAIAKDPENEILQDQFAEAMEEYENQTNIWLPKRGIEERILVTSLS